MAESGEVEDDLFDLNKVPVDRKRKRVEKNSNSTDTEDEGSDCFIKSGRVLRSRTVPRSDSKKPVSKVVETSDDTHETDVHETDSESESDVPVSRRRTRKVKRRRPPKTESKCQVRTLSTKEKGRRGRPPKNGGKSHVKVNVEAMELKLVSEVVETSDDTDENQVHETESESESDVPVSRRPPKRETKCEVSTLSTKEKGRRGRPPKNGGKSHVKVNVEAMELKLVSEVVETSDDTDENQVHETESESESESDVPVSRRRPPERETKCEVSTLSKKGKRKRGRPPKNGGKSHVKENVEAMELKLVSEVVETSDDTDENQVHETECESESDVPVSRRKPPKRESKCEVSTLSKKGKRKRGRPPKNVGKSHVKENVKAMELKHVRGVVEPSDDTDENQVHEIESDSESDVPVSRRRPPKTESECEVRTLSIKEKRKRGRPPKNGGKSETTPSSHVKENGEAMELKKMNASSDGMKVKRKLGRPRKMENGNMDFSIRKKILSASNGNAGMVNKLNIITDDTSNRFTQTKKGITEVAKGKETSDNDQNRPVRNKKVNANELENAASREEKRMPKPAPGKELGLREQKQVIRDQIVSMITKAGWSIEYRQRQSKDYQDAVYVDREGRTYWSVTLAYRKFKERIDEGKASEEEVSVFSPIPEETFSILFRITTQGKKAGKKKNDAGKTIKTKRKESSKRKSSDGNPRLNKGSQRTLLARKHKDGSDTSDNVYERNRNLISWMIDLGTVPLGGKVEYKRGSGEQIASEGRITNEGICCDCCKVTRGVREFVSHTESISENPYKDIYLETGVSLLQCLMESWKKHVKKSDKIGFVSVDVEGDDPNDDTCNICGDGGDLICCDSCPSTFHEGCLYVEVPSGDWHCVYCLCKFCGLACESISASDNESDASSDLFTCCLCEEKYHMHCIEGTITADIDLGNSSFCGKECYEIYEQLQVLLGVKHEVGEGFSYTVHHIVSDDAALDGDSSKVERNAKLAAGFLVMDECFQPIIDERSGTNMIQNVVYSCGSNIRRLNYDGFYTIILEKGDEAVAAASIRIHGARIAEMPFIGTRFIYRRQGICSRLLASIEKVLGSLGVEKLVIPAITELNETWTKVFGFGPLEEQTKNEMARMSMIVFPGVDMLQKPLIRSPSTEPHMGYAEHVKVIPQDRTTLENTESLAPSTEAHICNKNAPEGQDEDTENVVTMESCEVLSLDIPDEADMKDWTPSATTQSTESETCNENTRETQGVDTGGVAGPNTDVADIKDGALSTTTQSTESQSCNENTREMQGVDTGGVAEPNPDNIESAETIPADLSDEANIKDGTLSTATQSTESQTCNENTRETQGVDTGGVTEPNPDNIESGETMPVDLSDEADIKDGTLSTTSTTQSTESQICNENTREAQGVDTGGVAELNADIIESGDTLSDEADINDGATKNDEPSDPKYDDTTICSNHSTEEADILSENVIHETLEWVM